MTGSMSPDEQVDISLVVLPVGFGISMCAQESRSYGQGRSLFQLLNDAKHLELPFYRQAVTAFYFDRAGTQPGELFQPLPGFGKEHFFRGIGQPAGGVEMPPPLAFISA